MDDATKIIWFSDPHLTESGVVEGAPCKAHLQRMVDHINTHHADAACCIASGDLTHNGTAEEYAAFRAIVADLKVPFLPMTGNHDHRETLCGALPPPTPHLEGFVQYRWDCGDLAVICLDTLDPEKDSGTMCARRLEWLTLELAQLEGRRVLVFMHHPPGPLGLGPLDDMPLRDHAPLMNILSAAPQVAHIFCGHVHRSVSGTIGGLPFCTLRSTSHQTKPPYLNWDWTDYKARDEAPQYAVILNMKERLLVQTMDLPDVP